MFFFHEYKQIMIRKYTKYEYFYDCIFAAKISHGIRENLMSQNFQTM